MPTFLARRRVSQRLGALAALAVLVSFAPAARADQPASSPAEPVREEQLAGARRLFLEAVDAQDAGRYREAVALYERARVIASSPTLLFNLGTCHERLDELLEAEIAFGQSLELAKTRGKADVEAESRAKLEALQTQIPRVVVRIPKGVSTAHVVATLDDKPIDTTALEQLRLNPGTHRLVVRSEQHERVFAVSIELPHAARRAIDVDFGAARGPERERVRIERVTVPHALTKNYVPAVIAGGATVAFAGGALVTGLVGHDQRDRFDELNAAPSRENRDERERLRSFGAIMFVSNAGLLVATALALGVSIYFFVRPPVTGRAGGTVGSDVTSFGSVRF